MLLVISLGAWFMCGRILFCAGYLLEAVFNVKMIRQPGYMMGIAASLILLLENFEIM